MKGRVFYFCSLPPPSQLGIYSYAYSRSSPSPARVGWRRNILCSNDANRYVLAIIFVSVRTGGAEAQYRRVYIPMGATQK
jgi:hypothetical protein